MKFKVLAESCTTGPCPRVYEYDEKDFLIQGYDATAHVEELNVPDGELLVLVPKEILDLLFANHYSQVE